MHNIAIARVVERVSIVIAQITAPVLPSVHLFDHPGV